jgi:GAF domain-containing protein
VTLGNAAEDAVAALRSAMASATGLLNVTEAAASVIADLVAAREVSISLLDDGSHWDVVDVSSDPGRETFYPNLRYPMSDYPIASDRLLSGRGYVASTANDPLMLEYAEQVPDAPIGAMMSAPIIALGGVHGEIFLIREVGAEPFTLSELALVTECAPLLGARLPALIRAYKEMEDDPAITPAMDKLTGDLDHLLSATLDDPQVEPFAN